MPTAVAVELVTKYVAVDITGRLSGDETTLEAVKQWMNEKNPQSGDCVVWAKTYEPPCIRKNMVECDIAAIRKNGQWIDL